MRTIIIAVLLTVFLFPVLGRADMAQPSDNSPEPGNEPKNVPTMATITFDPQTVQVMPEGDSWKVVAVSGTGDDKILFDMGSNGVADQAARVLKFHNVSEIVEVSMPGEVEYVFSKAGKAPTGKLNGEQCNAFDPATLAVTEFKGKYKSATGEDVTYTQWSVDSGKRMVMRFNGKPLAEEMVSIVRKYGCRNRCHVGEFWYLRK